MMPSTPRMLVVASTGRTARFTLSCSWQAAFIACTDAELSWHSCERQPVLPTVSAMKS